MSLAGRRIVITRAIHQADGMTEHIEAAGGIPVLYPCIAIVPPDDVSALSAALDCLATFDWLILTSTNTTYMLARLQPDADWSQIKIAVVGSKTAASVRDLLGCEPHFMPDDYDADALAEQLPLTVGEHVFLPQSALADDSLADALQQRGAQVTLLDAYQTTLGTGGDDVPDLLEQGQIDALTFTSSSTVTNFVTRIAPMTAYDTLAVCIGASTHETALEAGFTQAHYPATYTIDAMIALLQEILEEVPYGNT